MYFSRIFSYSMQSKLISKHIEESIRSLAI
nr:MAG TPA: hypothetical protein [Crassvirales sp.]